ncbi:HNH endonuclease [Inquilinus limosus]|uniref:HNH endonuclease n=1 Tax=Inquilinus limosus TaxID=171674 RepID=UPI0009DC23DE|nr:HNH endonuclease [Inquilinus limosus]
MPYTEVLPSKAEIFGHWKDRFAGIGIFVDWGEPSCWACGFHYAAKYDIKSPDANWNEILDGWGRIPLQRCHIVPRSLGGADKPDNLFLMCRECHDLAPNTALPEIFFEWARAQSYLRREMEKINEALRSFSVSPKQYCELLQVIQTSDFKLWKRGKLGLHRPQSKIRPGIVPTYSRNFDRVSSSLPEI